MIGRDVVVEAEVVKQLSRRRLNAPIIADSPANQRDPMNHDAALTTINR